MRNMNSKVELTLSRRVRVPQAGPDAYTSDSKRIVFTYGKNGQYKSSKEAGAAAKAEAPNHLQEASEVCIVIWRGHRGRSETLKDSKEMFTHKFDGTVVLI